MTRGAPPRPCVSACVSARRDVVDGDARLLLFQRRTGRYVVLGEREWDLLCCADGTRDIEGVARAAAARGRRVSEAAIEGFFDSLAELGFFDAEEAVDDPDLDDDMPAISERRLEGRRALIADRPLEALPDAALHCDGRGACCSMFPTVIFSPEEARRALVIGADSEGPLEEEALFTPERGASFERWGAAHGARAVTLREGRCSFLEPSGLCRLHRLGGLEAKPAGCSLYPLRFVDDGEVIRVSSAPECACFFARPCHERGPLLPREVRIGADLPLAAHVATLPEEISLSATTKRSRAELRRWSRAVLEALEGRDDLDLVATLLLLSERLESGSLDATLPRVSRRGEVKIRGSLELELRDLREGLLRWEGLLTSWLSSEAPLLPSLRAVVAGCDELLESSAPRQPSKNARQDERNYGRTFFFGHHWCDDGQLGRALRERALRLMISRTRAITGAYLAEEHPLAMVEATLRAMPEP